MRSVFAHSPPSPLCEKDDCTPSSPLSLPPITHTLFWTIQILISGSLWRPLYVLGKRTDIGQDGDRFFILPIFYRTPVSRDIDRYSLAKISEILAGVDILSTPTIVMFLYDGLVQMSWYSGEESPPMKAGRPAATTHLVTACGEHNILKKENISKVWETVVRWTSPQKDICGSRCLLGGGCNPPLPCLDMGRWESAVFESTS